jgi:hypothetical protein
MGVFDVEFMYGKRQRRRQTRSVQRSEARIYRESWWGENMFGLLLEKKGEV